MYLKLVSHKQFDMWICTLATLDANLFELDPSHKLKIIFLKKDFT